MQDLLGAAGKLTDLGHALERHKLPAGCDDGQRPEVLRPLHEPIIALDDEVDPVAIEEVVGGVSTVDEAVDDVAELPGVELHVGSLLEPWHELHLRAREIERGFGEVLTAGGCLREFAHHLHAELHKLGEVWARDLDVDRASGAEAALEQARLLRHRERAGKIGRHAADQRH